MFCKGNPPVKPLLGLLNQPLVCRLLAAPAALIVLIAAPPPASAQTVRQQIVTQPGTPPHRLNAKTLSQISALEAEADARTPAQQKISSQLLFALKMARSQPITPGVPVQRTTAAVDGAGFTLVDMDAAVTPALLGAIQNAGGRVVGSSVRFGQVRASIPLGAVETLASLPGVRFIKPAVKAQLQRVTPQSGMGQMRRKAALLTPLLGPSPLSFSLPGGLPGINFDAAAGGTVGSYDDEGDKTHQANTARAAFGVSGSGIKVGVLSDSLDNGNGIYRDAVNSGDVSPVSVISGQSGGSGSGEGLAMLEVVHHLAPGAQLYFATGAAGEGQFADNIIALQQAGCKVIIDDEAYSDESPFQDDIIAKAINTVTANGVMYFSCAANYGNLANGTSSVWENDFASSGSNETGDGLTHQFDANGDELNSIQAPSGQTTVSLFWSDPLGRSSNDYDLFIVDPNGNIVASSTNRQTGSQDPYEQADAADGDSIAIVQHSGAGRYLHVDLDAQQSILNYATNDRTRGHNAAANAFCIAAAPAAAGRPDGPNGPYPNPFSSSDQVETFSNDGPRHVFYNPNGSAITPNNFSTTGGTVLYKPDFTAADGTTTTLTQDEVGTGKEALSPFFGTSCAAPHAGAIAALVLSYNPSLTRAQLATILKNSATDILGSGYDIDSGTGILNAYKALQNTPAPTVNTSVKVAAASGTAGQSVTLSATLTATSGGGLSGKTLAFKVDSASAGTATTNSSGTASLSYTIPVGTTAGSHTITAAFSGGSGDGASSGTGTLTVTAASSPYQVRFFPRAGWESRMTGGQFQGSHDNSAWTTLATVSQTPAAGQYSTLPTSTDPKTFRFLRYLAPSGSYGDVAEIEFDSGGVKLTGTGFGTAGSYNNSGNTFGKALDGSTSTYFDAPAPGNGDFVGIDQGAAATAGQVRYWPQTTYPQRMVGGQFQGSHDNSAWTTLATVTQTPPTGQYSTLPTSADPKTFRFLRYLAPNGSYGNVAEVEFDSGTGASAVKLMGTAFGTAGSYNNDGFTFGKALDGDTSTYFNAPAPGNGDFVGIDQGPTYTKLTGTGFGTAGSYNNSGNTYSKALDGSLSTYFDAPAPGNGDFVGLDLGSGHAAVVTRIGYCPRSTYPSRMVGGIFQGSNDNSAWTTLYTVSSAPATGGLTKTTAISSGTAFRYVRYLAPSGSYGDVAEIEFDTSP